MHSKAQTAMTAISVTSVILTIAFIVLYRSIRSDVWFSLAITCGTVAYQFVMRLAVGWCIAIRLRKQLNCKHAWFMQKAILIVHT